MKAQSKSAFIIVATLVVGILVGALATSAVMNNRMEELNALRSKGGFSENFLGVVQPENEVQRAQIKAILENADNQMEEARLTMYREIRAVTDSMRQRIALLLTPEQQARVDEWQEAQRRQWRERGDRGRPQGERGSDSRNHRKPDQKTERE